MKKLLKEIIEELRLKELERIKSELEPHFEKYGELGIENNHIRLFNDKGWFDVVCTCSVGTFYNYFTEVYDETNININDVFEKISDREWLDEIKIKQVNKFDVNEWKKDFAKKYNLKIDDDDYVTDKYDCLVISRNNDVNYDRWHRNLFDEKHDVFKFDNKKIIKINSQELAEEFERVYVIMRDYLDKIESERPNLKKNNIKEFDVEQ